MGLLALILSYEYPLFFMLQVVFGLDEGGAGLKLFSSAIFGVVLIIYLASIGRKKRAVSYTPVIFVIIILFLFILTGVNFSNTGFYRSYLLSFGVRCVPAALVGSMVADDRNAFDKMLKWIQPFMLFFTLGVLLTVINASDATNIKEKYSVASMNYQTLSYCAAFAFNINLYVLSMWKVNPKFKFFSSNLWRGIDFFLLPLQLYCMLSAGGRGAIANVIVCMLLIVFIKGNLRFKIRHIILILSLIIAAIVVIDILSKNGNIGASRLKDFFGNSNNLFENDRSILRKRAIQVFFNSNFAGRGIGSVFFTMDFYSHNIFTDILAEGGVVGIIIVIIILKKILSNLKKIYYQDRTRLFVYVIFFSSFAMLMFSGYYLADGGLWFAATYILCCDTERKKESGSIAYS